MSEPKTAKAEFETTIDNFLNLADLEISLTYGFAAEPIVFPVRLMMNDDEIAARTAFYLQTDDEKASTRHKYNVDMLSSILVGRPKGLPGFDELANAANANASSPADVLKSYLMRGGPIAEKIANDAIERYSRMTTPAEFFR